MDPVQDPGLAQGGTGSLRTGGELHRDGAGWGFFQGGKQPGAGLIRPDKEQSDVFLNSIRKTLAGDNSALKHAAMNCLSRFMSIDDSYSAMADSALEDIKTDIF